MPAKRRNFPTETVTDRRPSKKPPGGEKIDVPETSGLLDMSPALREGELAELERIIESATPEQFQAELSKVFRKMLTRGLKDIPPPKSIKEFQVIYDMFRKAEGIERADKAGGPVGLGFLPRVVGRRNVGAPVETEVVSPDTSVVYPPEVVPTQEAEITSGSETGDPGPEPTGDPGPEPETGIGNPEIDNFEV